MQVVFTVAAALVMDRLGRRILLLVSALFMTVSISLLGMYFYFAKHEPDVAQSMAILPVVSLSVFVAMFSIGFGPIPWLMMSELFSPEVKKYENVTSYDQTNPFQVKSVASSAATTTNWTLAFIVTKFFQDMVSGVGGKNVCFKLWI